jgi:signal transduction histidine kinase
MAPSTLAPILPAASAGGATERARLAALHATALLDSPAEEAFDRLTRLATRLLHVPVALVSLVDEDRQFFKSCIGLPEPWASARETPLSHSFCQHAVQLGEPLLIEDAREHPLVCDSRAIRDLGVVAYAGIPLATADGLVLGSFCVIDGIPRAWTAAQVATLRDLAGAAITEIELRSALKAAEAARAEAAEASRAKDDFLALVSHELRTPLAAIVGNAQMLGMALCGPLGDAQARAVERIRLGGDHLQSLIDQLLDFKRLAAGHAEYVLEDVSVASLLDTAAALAEGQFARAGVRLVRGPTADGTLVRTDQERARQVLLNLLSNAAKFTPAGGLVELAVARDGTHAHLRVRDTGIGIPAARLGDVFEPFVRLRDRRAPSAGGTGLGLAISRDYAHGMGGALAVESVHGAGSTFTLSLPLA